MTIQDIARMAGVSIATVSRVINNHKVGAEIRKRVLKIIEKHAYHPNAYAQYLGQRNRAKFNHKTGSAYNKT